MADEGLSAGAVARRLGVAVTTLRTWHQRYGLGPSQHIPGQHRRYSDDDLARLEIMRRLTAQGVPPAEAARWARRPEPAAPPTGTASGSAAGQGPGPPAGGGSDPAAGRPSAPSAIDQGPQGPSAGGRHGGGFAIPLGRASTAARGLARAAMRLDTQAMRELIERSVAGHGVVVTWDHVIRPVLAGIGERHAATATLVEVEHLVSRTVSEVFGAVPRPAAGPPPVTLLTCADEEQHSLPLEALAAALAQAGISCRLLGARVPPAALRETVARTGPRAVIIWSHAPETADPAQLQALLAGPHRPLLVAAAGPGWRPDTLPPEVLVPASLGQAVKIVRDVTDSLFRAQVS